MNEDFISSSSATGMCCVIGPGAPGGPGGPPEEPVGVAMFFALVLPSRARRWEGSARRGFCTADKGGNQSKGERRSTLFRNGFVVDKCAFADGGGESRYGVRLRRRTI